MIRQVKVGLIGLFILTSCGGDVPIPKPRMYPKVVFPEREIALFDNDLCSFSFEFPDYGTVVRDSLFFEEEAAHPCWFNIDMKSLNAQLHCSYNPISKEKDFDKLLKDAFKLVGKHNSMANYRQENLIENPDNDIYGLLFNIEGPVATPLQFYLTDSTDHFFRASLYFNARVNPDSTQVVFDFIQKDIFNMIETFEWESGD